MSVDWWLQSGTTSTAEGPAMQGQANQVRNLELSTGIVKSENLTTNPLTRSHAAPLIGRTASSSAGYSTGASFTLWRPLVPLTIQRVQLFNNESWVLTTDTDFVVFRNSSSCVAGVTVVSTTLAAGARTAFAAVDNASIAACTDLTLKFAFSTCAEPSTPRGFVQFDYITTG